MASQIEGPNQSQIITITIYKTFNKPLFKYAQVQVFLTPPESLDRPFSLRFTVSLCKGRRTLGSFVGVWIEQNATSEGEALVSISLTHRNYIGSTILMNTEDPHNQKSDVDKICDNRSPHKSEEVKYQALDYQELQQNVQHSMSAFS